MQKVQNIFIVSHLNSIRILFNLYIYTYIFICKHTYILYTTDELIPESTTFYKFLNLKEAIKCLEINKKITSLKNISESNIISEVI